MSLTQALTSALAGLQVTQSGLSVVAGNVANVQTPDYVRKTLSQIETGTGNAIGVRAAGINRELNQLIQMQLRTEVSGGGYADVVDQIYQQLQSIYGSPGSSLGLDSLLNKFNNALQTLMASPADVSAQNGAVNAARVLAQQLNAMSDSVQMLRSAAEQGIAADVQTANDALQHIADINQRIGPNTTLDATSAALLDQRDGYIDQLSKLMGIKVVQGDNNQVSVYTSNGLQLVGATAVQVSFDSHGSLSPDAVWSQDPTVRGVGTITLTAPGGSSLDLIASGALNSGEIGGYLQMRDQILPQAQRQLDELAASMAKAASDVTTDGQAVTTVVPQAGFDLNVAGLQAGNTIQFTYTDASSVSHDITLVRVDDPAALPLSNSLTANPNDQVIGINFSGGMASVVTQLTAALGPTGLVFSTPAPNTLRILNDALGTITVNSASTTQTMTSLTSGNAQLPLFTDGASAFTGAITASGSQITGLAGRLAVNGALLSNPGYLVTYQTSPATAAGDPTRPTFLFDQMANAGVVFSPASGIGSANAPFSGTLSAFVSQVISTQGQAAANASNLRQGQDIVVNTLQDKLNKESGVNIDQEMTNLLNLQTAYGANARVLSAVKDMFTMLLSM
jgi:flagellar hook-associated protein 1 FlgK